MIVLIILVVFLYYSFGEKKNVNLVTLYFLIDSK